MSMLWAVASVVLSFVITPCTFHVQKGLRAIFEQWMHEEPAVVWNFIKVVPCLSKVINQQKEQPLDLQQWCYEVIVFFGFFVHWRFSDVDIYHCFVCSSLILWQNLGMCLSEYRSRLERVLFAGLLGGSARKSIIITIVRKSLKILSRHSLPIPSTLCIHSIIQWLVCFQLMKKQKQKFHTCNALTYLHPTPT